jgi:hypothetical protein
VNITEIRQKYPQYEHVSDGELAAALHKKYYAHVPYADFEKKVFNTQPVKLGAEGMPDAIKATASEFSGASNAMVGAAGAINKAAMALKQRLGRDLTPEDIQGLDEYKALSDASGAAVAGDIGMNVIATMQPGTFLYNLGKNATTLAGRAVPRVAAALAPTVGSAASAAPITLATRPTMEGETTAGNVAEGVAGAVVADAATRGAARIAQPIIQSKPVQKLLHEGIVPTVGQSVGGFINRIEQQLESIPIVGAFITNARGRAVKEMNEAAIRKALPAETAEVVKAGRAGVERAGEIMDGAYDRAYAGLRGLYGGDKPFQNALKEIPNREGIDLPPSLKERFEKLIQDRVWSKLDKGDAKAAVVRDVHNSLGALARKYKGSTDPDQRALGEAFAQAKAELRESVSRQTQEGSFKTTLDALDKKYSALKAVEKASGYQGSKDGVFSAEALKRASAKSTSEMRGFSETSADVLGRTVPDSGTAGRMLLPFSVAGGNEYLGGPDWLTGIALGSLAAGPAYSRIGSRYALGGYPFQPTLAELIRSSSPYTSQLGRSIGDQ